MDDLLAEFLIETSESLAVIDSELVIFEQNPRDAATLGNIFRLVHTIKGTCGFLGLSRLEAVAHAGENVLGRFRDGAVEVRVETVTLVLQCIDIIRYILESLERDGVEPKGDDIILILALNRAAETSQDKDCGDTSSLQTDLSGFGSLDRVRSALGQTDGNDFPVAAELLEEVAAAEAAGFRAASGEEVRAESATTPAQSDIPTTLSKTVAVSKAPLEQEVDSTSRASIESTVIAQSIRVPVETLETLMTLVSELVLTRNQLLQMIRGQDDSEFTVPLQRLSHITSELQEGVMKTRMQPIGTAWAKLPRIVRDLALETGKKLDLRMHGAETELDRQVLELIKDPLTHMVRNSSDHGIEPPNERRKVGKPETGVIRLCAYHEGGHVVIEIQDDGRGLDIDKIRNKAVANGIATQTEIAEMSEQQLFQFIFMAGFSTSDKVSNVSGRGVGMDVVRTNIEKIGGTIELKSHVGIGSTFVIKIPLTLAIISALILSCHGNRFAVPQICVLELVRVAASGENRFEMINDVPLLRLRNKLLPLVDLSQLLGLDKHQDRQRVVQGQFVVVTQIGQTTFGIIVDEVFDTEEIVVKPISPMLGNIPYYAGNTILGDGDVIMILDPNGIASVIGHRSTDVNSRPTVEFGDEDSKAQLLLFRDGDNLKVVPLDLVARLEDIDLKKVEWSQGRSMVQYRGHLMPLVICDPSFDWRREGSAEILVFTDRQRSMGLVVCEVVDIVYERLVVEVSSSGQGVLGSAIINGRATDVIDAGFYLTKAFPEWFSANGPEALAEHQSARRILLIEDSSFFRGLIAPTLEAAGYAVTAVTDASHALQLCDSGAEFDAIISDIELPGMNGFEFAERVRADQRWGTVPLVALSGHTSTNDLERGRAAGFTDYVAKYDRNGLLASLACHVPEDLVSR